MAKFSNPALGRKGLEHRQPPQAKTSNKSTVFEVSAFLARTGGICSPKPYNFCFAFSPVLSNLYHNLKEFKLHTTFHRSLSFIKVTHENSPSAICKKLSLILDNGSTGG